VNALLGTKFKLIRGYPGLKAGMLAMERGEVAGTGSITWASLKATNGEWLRDGKVRLLVQYGVVRHSDLPDVPSIYEYAKSDADRAAMSLVFGRQEYGRPYVAPPALPASIVDLLRRAFDATMKDPAFLKDAKSRGLDIDPITGEQMDLIIANLYKSPPEILERVKGILGEAK
jgi:tripartite-type tricarboxylate transporter receptor subunit TctC